MKNTKILYMLYVGIIVFSLTLLSIFMFVDTTSNENETTVSFPLLIDENGINQAYSTELEYYFSQNFGFRNNLVQLNAKLKDTIFKTSAVNNVIIGKDGYLYYTDTTNDYLGISSLNDREVFNITHTLELIQEYVEANNGQFMLMVAPNKNSLYQYMPNQYIKIGNTNNKDLVFEKLNTVNHLDLFSTFNSKEEKLYYKTDSHWNSEGALLVYNTTLNTLNKEVIDFSKYPTTSSLMKGDLYHMLYPSKDKNEVVTVYQKNKDYQYLTNTRSNEQNYIETVNLNANGSLLMFRDSFANNLVDYFSESYQYAIYDKTNPYNFLQMKKYNTDTVIVEIAERNISLLQENQPVFMAPKRMLTTNNGQEKKLVDKINIVKEENYISFSGSLNEDNLDINSKIYLEVDGVIYEMSPQKYNDSTFGFFGCINTTTYNTLKIHVETNQFIYTQGIK